MTDLEKMKEIIRTTNRTLAPNAMMDLVYTDGGQPIGGIPVREFNARMLHHVEAGSTYEEALARTADEYIGEIKQGQHLYAGRPS